jgi:hypothetical protein
MVNKLRSFSSIIDKRIDKKIQELSKQLMNDIVYDAQVNFSKRHTVDSKILDKFFIEQTDKYSWLVGNNHPKSKLIEVGSPPHPIPAKNKPMLVFETEKYQSWNNEVKYPKIGRDGGFLKVTDSVNHPGFDGSYYLKDSIESNIKKFVKSLKSKL